MIELEDVDLAKALSMAGKVCLRLAQDIPTELDSPERTHEVAGVLEEAARQLRARAWAMPPKVVDAEPSPGLVPRTFSNSGPGPEVPQRHA